MKILFLVNSFKRGGAERVIINLLNQLPVLNSDLKLFLYFLEEASDPYPVPAHVHLRKHIRMPKYQYSKLFVLPKQAFDLKKYVQSHHIDLILSFLSRSNYVNMFAKMFGSTHQAIMSERNTPSLIYGSKNLVDLINRLLIRITYPRYDKIIAPSNGVKNDLVTNFNILAKKITVIHNPYDIGKIKKEARINIDHQWINDSRFKTIVSLGRLEKQKNYPLLISAFEQVAKKFSDTRLIIIGEGSQRLFLTDLINQLNLGSHIDLIGHKHHPYGYLSRADLFVLSSDYEGFPNVLVEAMICGCPVISTDCRSGPNEIINNGSNGYLVPVGDVDALSKITLYLIQNDRERKKIAENALKTVKKYSVSAITRDYYNRLIQNRNSRSG